MKNTKLKSFCPIGGGPNSLRAPIFQENICIPYTKGFLNELFPNLNFEANTLHSENQK